jgi:hypothetical protein
MVFMVVTPFPLGPPKILQIYRDFVKPGSEAAFRTVEEDAARMCAELHYPHPHAAIESVTDPREVWWLNAFASETERQRVESDYANNRPLTAALDTIGPRKKDLIGAPVDILANYRADLSHGEPWTLAGARFVVVTVTAEDPRIDASVYEGPDGTRFAFRPVRTAEQADVVAAAAGPGTMVFAVRPYWGMPAREWVAADPDFWGENPSVR